MGTYVTIEDVEAFEIVVPEMIAEAIMREGIRIDAERINQEARSILMLLKIGSAWSEDLETQILKRTLQAADHLIGYRFPIH